MSPLSTMVEETTSVLTAYIEQKEGTYVVNLKNETFGSRVVWTFTQEQARKLSGILAEFCNAIEKAKP